MMEFAPEKWQACFKKPFEEFTEKEVAAPLTKPAARILGGMTFHSDGAFAYSGDTSRNWRSG